MRRHISSKPQTCTEAVVVYAAGISVKVTRLTLGGLLFCPWLRPSRGGRMGQQNSAEAIVGDAPVTEGPNMLYESGAPPLDDPEQH